MRNFIWREWPLLLIVLATCIAAIAIYPRMPDSVPIHWNIWGVADAYGSKFFGTFFLPVLNLGMYGLFLLLPNLDPKKANYQKFSGSYRLIRILFHVFMSGMFVLTIMATLGYRVDIGFWIPAGTALLIIFLGNVLSRVRHNYFVGFRFPWTLANEEVWRKTHRFGSKAMVTGGILVLAGVIAAENQLRFIILMAGIILPVIFTTVYSYWIYKKKAS